MIPVRRQRGFLVLGPESSGTRLATSILIAGGCHGSAGHEQAFDSSAPPGLDPVVLRRSLPHGAEHRWWRVPEMLSLLGEREAMAVVTVRDWRATVASQLAAPHVETAAEAAANIARAYRLAFGGLEVAGVPYRVLVYESLVERPAAVQRWLWRELGLDERAQPVEVYDGNAPHYEEEV